MIKVMKASAGAGKTYNLAKTYIRLLLEKAQDSYAYRHILAVTFTNKATAEMKTRILNELFILAKNPTQSAYYNDFVPSLASDSTSLGKIAGCVLSNILHDYSAFSVSTIDKFFQQTLKAFSREIGQFSSYQVELDRDSLVSESVDRLLDSITDKDKKLLDWLKSNVLEQIESGGSYRVDANLTEIAKRILSSQRKEILQKNGFPSDMVYTKEKLYEIRKACRETIKTYENQVHDQARKLLDILNYASVDPAESNRGFLKGLYKYVDDSLDRIESPTDSFLAKATVPDDWFAKSKKDKLLPQVQSVLEEPLSDFVSLFGKPFALYNTALIIDSQLFGMGVASELSEIFRNLMKEKNVLCLDDSNTILKNIIDGSDAPFVYEKIGVRFDNFLLDEFQDTSRVQWDNFRPLLINSDANGQENLVVGDVKQSIYRWRGSDWKLFDQDVYQGFTDVSEENLPANYRSLSSIVEFNNDFFTNIASQLDLLIEPGIEPGTGRISRIYANVSQNVGKKSSEDGSVEFSFCSKDEEVDKVLEVVHQVMDRGARAKDIAVLVRSRAVGEKIAVALINDGQSVVTDDSLRVKSSVVVRRLVALLSYVDNPKDSIASYMVSSLNIVIPGNCHSLIDLAESLYRQLLAVAPQEEKKLFTGEFLHIQSFMDSLQEYTSLNGNDLRGFLKDWEEKNPSISSPSNGDSIRVMTVHKSKGLDFPFVIIPFIEDVTLFKTTDAWCYPNLKNTPLEACADGVYDVKLSSRSENTLFVDNYKDEKFLQIVDNINVLYVAMTRASKGMHLIAAEPEQKHLMGAVERYNMADFLKLYVGDDNIKGTPYVFANDSREVEQTPEMGCYPSFALNPSEGETELDVRERGRLKFTADAVDFFAESGDVGMDASHRVKGIVMHDILAKVEMPSDLDGAIGEACSGGIITIEESKYIRSLLSEAIESVMERGWFPDERACVRNEVSIIDTDGSNYRPDRVVKLEDELVVIDYKFGQHEPRYERQIAKYAQLYRRMGYKKVSAFLWYVMSGEIRQV